LIFEEKLMNLNLDFLLEPPDFSVRGKLTIEALAPLSMVSSMPGKYYRCQPEPTDEMLFGMIENAFGIHLTGKTDKARDKFIKRISQRHHLEIQTSDVGFSSVLQFHIRVANRIVPDSIHYDDYWSRHAKHTDKRHIDGSRSYDYRVIPTLNRIKSKEIELNDKEIIGYFPQYYITPTPRSYVVPQGSYKFVLETSARISKLLAESLENPHSPIYLGSNDGWIEVSYEEL
jgi:CRISPR-associated protein Cas5